ncbi:MAG TPA: response regulator [Chthoniobacterales bacterium]|nr:response regulator [Chthoniobacterales bacterium]
MSAFESDKPSNSEPSSEFVAKATSELNNLLQIISGSRSALEQANRNEQETAEYFDMLRASVDRAEVLGQELANRAGGTAEKAICNAEVGTFLKKKSDRTKAIRQTILVVDDEKMVLTLIGRFLRDAGYEVVTAQSGFEAVDFFRREPLRYSLVLLDFSLPFMDGGEVFRRLREIRNNIPVVLCTGFIVQEQLKGMLGQGLSGFLRKPVPPDELIAVVKSTLQRAMYSQDTTDPSGISVVS